MGKKGTKKFAGTQLICETHPHCACAGPSYNEFDECCCVAREPDRARSVCARCGAWMIRIKFATGERVNVGRVLDRDERNARLLLKYLCAVFGFRTEMFVERRHRVTGEIGIWHACRVYSLKSGRQVLELGGSPDPVLARRKVMEALLVDVGKICAVLPKPPEFDRKDWLRKNVIAGGKTETADPAAEPGHGEP